MLRPRLRSLEGRRAFVPRVSSIKLSKRVFTWIRNNGISLKATIRTAWNEAKEAVCLENAETEGLLGNGWLNIVSAGKQKISGDAPLACRYSQIAFQFYELVR